jgi:hypothetical protein
MTSKTVTVLSTMDTLLGAYRSHVLGRTLPEPASLNVIPGTREIAVQANGGLDVVAHLGNLLLWACTLTEVTAEWWHTDGGRLHISITGRTSGGVRMKVYGGCEFAESAGLVQLDPGQEDNVSLDELYTLVGLLREHHVREVA